MPGLEEIQLATKPSSIAIRLPHATQPLDVLPTSAHPSPLYIVQSHEQDPHYPSYAAQMPGPLYLALCMAASGRSQALAEGGALGRIFLL